MGKPRLGDIVRAQIRIKESKEFKVSKIFRSKQQKEVREQLISQFFISVWSIQIIRTTFAKISFSFLLFLTYYPTWSRLVVFFMVISEHCR